MTKWDEKIICIYRITDVLACIKSKIRDVICGYLYCNPEY